MMNPEPTLQDVIVRVDGLTSRVDDLASTVEDLTSTMQEFATSVDRRFETVDQQFDRIDQRFERIESTLATKEDLHRSHNEIINHIDHFIQLHRKQETEIAALHHRMDRHESTVHA